jgi:hypothetical protein
MECAMSTQMWLMMSGIMLVSIGVLIRWGISGYDLKDAAIESAWTLARRKRTAENPTALEIKYRDIAGQPTWRGRARKAAGTVAGHFAAQVLALVSLVMMLAGLALIVAGFFWR